MPTVAFHLDSRLSVGELIAVLTDFSPARADVWPTIDADHLEVHAAGDNWAEVTEGTADAWERSRYEWDAAAGRVVITTHESKRFGPGGGWVFQLTPQPTGTRVDVELTRTSQLMPPELATALEKAPAALAAAFAGPLQAEADPFPQLPLPARTIGEKFDLSGDVASWDDWL